MTFDELNKLALECQDETAAQALLRNVDGCRWDLPNHGVQGDAHVIIGYIGGYEDRETQQRLWSIFKTEHFGFSPKEILSEGQLFMCGWRVAAREGVPENKAHLQALLDEHDFISLRTWLRDPLPGEPPWPDKSIPLMVVVIASQILTGTRVRLA